MKRSIILAGTLISALLNTGLSGATIKTYGFYCITNNDPVCAAIGEAQLFVDVSDEYANQVLFNFRNIGPNECSISEIYFDDSILSAIATIINDPPKVEFVQWASPPELPGANLVVPPFETTVGFLAEAEPPPAKKGVNPGEQVGILFDIEVGADYQEAIDALNNGSLRIGIHVIGFAQGCSEAFVNIPEPATIALIGFGALAALRRRKR